jgi:hypothetical protein
MNGRTGEVKKERGHEKELIGNTVGNNKEKHSCEFGRRP